MVRRGPHHPNITWVPHLRVSWGGSLGTGKEIWTNAVRFQYLDPAFVPSEAQLTGMQEGVRTRLAQWFTGAAQSFIGQDAKLIWLKLVPINAQGLQVSANTHVYDWAGGGINGLDLNSVPFYQTYALTFRTAAKRGRGHSGRIFPPCVQPVVEAGTGQCTAADATAMATSFAQCLTQMNTDIAQASQVGSFAVFSPGDTLKGTTPLALRISGVVADRTPDVQHRRTNKIPRAEGVLTAVT